MQALTRSLHRLDVKSQYCVQIACLMRCKTPPTFDHVEYPEKRRLAYVDKIPPPMSAGKAQLKMPKLNQYVRGPEEVHNRIIYGEFGIQALEGGRLKFGHFEIMRMQVIRKMNDKKCFAVYRVDPSWQAVSKRPIGHRHGGGKGAIKYFVTPVKAGRIVMEIGGHGVLGEVEKFLTTIVGILPFKARIVTRELLESEEGLEEEMEKRNQNPFTFKYCAKNNSNGIKKFLSPYDFDFHGKYR